MVNGHWLSKGKGETKTCREQIAGVHFSFQLGGGGGVGGGLGGGGRDKIRRCKEAEDRTQWAVDKGWDK